MTTRTAYIYALDIDYPEGSREPGWRPARWSDPVFRAKLSHKARRAMDRATFKWPRERMFLSSSGACERAWLLRFYGATVDVRRSRPVEWPDVAWLAEDLEDSPDPALVWPEFDASGIPVGTVDEAWLALSEVT